MEQLFKFLKTNIHFVILIAYAFILYNYIDEKDTSIMLGFTVITAFILFQSRHIVEGQAATTVAKAIATVDSTTNKVTAIILDSTATGQGYRTGTTVVITPDSTDTSAKDAAATVVTNSDGTLGAITVTNGGSGYTKVPTITFINGPKTPDQKAAENIEKVLESIKYKRSLNEKGTLLDKLDNLKAANEKDPVVIAPQQYLQKDTLIKVQKGIPRIGTYDGLCLSGLTTKTNYNLVSNDKINAYMGVQYPTEELATEDDSLDGPSIDGDDDSPHKLSMFANNMTSINCCGDSPYVSSSGCVCMTKKQKNFIQNRGLYATTNSFIDVEDDSDTTTDITVGSLPKPTDDEIILLDDNVNKQPTNKQKAFDYKDLLN